MIDRWVTSLDPAARREPPAAPGGPPRRIRRAATAWWSSGARCECWLRCWSAPSTVWLTVCAPPIRNQTSAPRRCAGHIGGGAAHNGLRMRASDCPRPRPASRSGGYPHPCRGCSLSGGSDATGYRAGSGVVPPAMLLGSCEARQVASTDTVIAAVRRVPLPPVGEILADFIRARDLTCRFRDATKPPSSAISTTIPWQQRRPDIRPTWPRCAVAHHLLKTFGAAKAVGGKKQHPDGRIVWTSPSGRTYTTTPGGALFFPQLAEPTGELNIVVLTDSRCPHTDDAHPSAQPAEERAARNQWGARTPTRRAGQPTRRRSGCPGAFGSSMTSPTDSWRRRTASTFRPRRTTDSRYRRSLTTSSA